MGQTPRFEMTYRFESPWANVVRRCAEPEGSPSQTGEKGRFLGREESAVDALELFERAEPELDLAPIVLVADLDGRA